MILTNPNYQLSTTTWSLESSDGGDDGAVTATDRLSRLRPSPQPSLHFHNNENIKISGSEIGAWNLQSCQSGIWKPSRRGSDNCSSSLSACECLLTAISVSVPPSLLREKHKGQEKSFAFLCNVKQVVSEGEDATWLGCSLLAPF